MTGIAAAGDEQLLRALHEEHAAALGRYVTSLLGGDRTRAQDVVQETFLRAWRNPRVLDQSGGSARGWLFTVARRIVIDEWRGAARTPEVLTSAVPETAGADMTEHLVDRQLVLAALRALVPEHRRVLLECYFRGSSIAQAAARLGVPEGTVKSRTHYALHALRDAMQELGGMP